MASSLIPIESQSKNADDRQSSKQVTPVKYSENVPGKYYVTDQCNACGLCKSIADELFDFNNEGTYYYVCKQPGTPEEQAMMDDAIDFCTANGIWWEDRPR
jgi:ferredoxin